MKIQWIAHACYRIEFENGKVMVTDPFDKIGYEMPEISADIVSLSHGHYDHNAKHKVGGSFIVCDEAKCYEAHDIRVTGIPSFHDKEGGAKRGSNLIYIIEAEGLKVAHLGDLGHALDESQKEALKNVDILMIPVGGNYTIDAAEAFEIIKEIEPNIVFPMHYKTPGLTVDISDITEFMSLVKGYYDMANEGSSTFKFTKADRKRNTRIVILKNDYAG